MRVGVLVFIGMVAACGASEPARPEPVFVAQLPLDKTIRQMAIANDMVFAAYLGESVPDVLFSVDVSQPENPQLVSTQTVDGLGLKLFADGSRLFSSSGVVFDVSNPALPSMVATISGWNGMAQIAGNFVQVDADLHVMDLSDVLAPREIGSLALTDSARDVAVDRSYAYVANRAITVVDLSDPSQPAIVATLPLPGVEWITAKDGIVYAGTFTGPYATADEIGLFVIDARTPSAPSIIGHIGETSSQGPYTVANDLLLTPHRLHDVSDASEPMVLGKPPLPMTDRGTLPSVNSVASTADGTFGIWGGAGLFVVDLVP